MNRIGQSEVGSGGRSDEHSMKKAHVEVRHKARRDVMQKTKSRPVKPEWYKRALSLERACEMHR